MMKYQPRNIFSKTKILVFALSVLVMSLMAFAAMAADIDDVGLSVTANNNFIKISDGKLGVFSYIENVGSGKRISSEKLIESLASSAGYELSYVDADKNDTVSSHVTDGYIKCTKDADVKYIPITDKIEYKDNYKNPSTSNSFAANGEQRDGTLGWALLSNNSATGGKAGKASDDYAFLGFKAANRTADGRYSYNIPNLNPNITTPQTFEFNVYADGEMEAMITVDGSGINLLQWAKDGSLFYRDGSGVTDSGFDAERGKWHKVAITYDSPSGRGRVLIYVDGKYIVNDSIATYYIATVQHFCMAAKSYTGDSTGYTLYDNLISYTGYYNPSEYQSYDYISYDPSAIIEKADEDTKYINSDFASTIDDLKSYIYCGDAGIKFFTPDFSREITGNIESEMIAVITDSSNTYKYIDFKLMQLDIDFVFIDETGAAYDSANTWTADTDLIGAKVNLTNSKSSAEDVAMVLVLKDSDGIIESISLSPETSVDAEPVTLTIPASKTAAKAEVFFIRSFSDRIRSVDKVFTIGN